MDRGLHRTLALGASARHSESRMETSPTGTPVLPPQFVPYVLLGGAALSVVANGLADPSPWNGLKLGRLLGQLVPAVLGILSPGWRRSP